MKGYGGEIRRNENHQMQENLRKWMNFKRFLVISTET